MGTQQIVAYLTYFVFAVVLARILSPSEVGEVSILATILAIFGGATQLGLPSTAIQFISGALGANNSRVVGSIVRSTMKLMILCGGAGVAIAFVASPLIDESGFGSSGGNLLLLTLISGFLLDLTTLYGGYFLGAGFYSEAVYQNVVYVPLSRGLGIAFALSGFHVVGIVLGWLTGGVVTLLLSVVMWRGRFHSKDRYPIKKILAFSVPIFASSFIILLQGWTDIIILQLITRQFAIIGAYYLVVTSIGFLSIIWTPLVSALYPVLSLSHAATGASAVRDKLNQALRLSNLVTLPISVAIASVASIALTVLYGSAYANQATTLLILSLGSVFASEGALLLSAVQAIGKPRAVFAVVSIAFMSDVVVVTLTASSIGTVGAGIGRTLLECVTVVSAYLFLRGHVKVSPLAGIQKACLLSVCVSLPLITVSLFVHTVNPLEELALMVGVFALALALSARMLKAFSRDDYGLLESALPQWSLKLAHLGRRILIKN